MRKNKLMAIFLKALLLLLIVGGGFFVQLATATFAADSLTISAASPINNDMASSLTINYSGSSNGNIILSATNGTVNPSSIPYSGTNTFNATFFPKAGFVGTARVTATAISSTAQPAFTDIVVTAGYPTALSITSGNNQSATVGTNFAQLQVRAFDSGGNPVSGAKVNFTIVPGTGGGSFGSSSTASANTDTNGYASPPTLTANNSVGTFSVTADLINCSDGCFTSDSKSFSLTNVAAPPPVLSVNPTTVLINGISGQAARAIYTSNVSLSAANGPITYTSSITYGGTATGWLSAAPASSTVIPGTPLPVTLSADSTTLVAGSYTAIVTFVDTNNPQDQARVSVTFAVAPAPTTTVPVTTTVATTTPIVTTTAPIVTTTPIPTVPTTTPAPTTTTATQTSTTTATTIQASGTITISGKVLINGVGAPGISVRLAGGTYQQTDANGNYGFFNVPAGRYQPVALVDTTKYTSVDGLAKATDVSGYVYGLISLAANQSATNVNFNLATVGTTTTTAPTTTPAPTNVATPTPTNTAISTTTPATTTTAGDTEFGGCQPLTPLASVLSFNYCTTQSPTDPNLFRVDVLVYNSYNVNLDLSHTLIFNLNDGSQVRQPSASTGQVSVNNTQLSWGGFQLAPGQGATLSFYISKAAGSLSLINSVNVTGVNQATSSPFSRILPKIPATAGRGQYPIYPIVGSTVAASGSTTVSSGNPTGSGNTAPSLPYTGEQAVAQTETNPLAIIVLVVGIVLSGVCAVGMVWQLRRKQIRR